MPGLLNYDDPVHIPFDEQTTILVIVSNADGSNNKDWYNYVTAGQDVTVHNGSFRLEEIDPLYSNSEVSWDFQCPLYNDDKPTYINMTIYGVNTRFESEYD